MKDVNVYNWSHDDVKKIVQRLQADDIEALGELYEIFSEKIYRRCSFLLKSDALAEDALHDIFMKVFRGVEDIKAETAFVAWLNRLVYNHCIDVLRKSSKIKTTILNEEYGASENLAILVEQLELETKLTDDLRNELDKLKELDRTVLSMYYWEEYSVKEIAEFLDLGESAIKMRLKRSRDDIKVNLNNDIE